jgi:hypothetical protein
MLDRNDRFFMLSTIIIPLILWWLFYGKNKYSLKGQK